MNLEEALQHLKEIKIEEIGKAVKSLKVRYPHHDGGFLYFDLYLSQLIDWLERYKNGEYEAEETRKDNEIKQLKEARRASYLPPKGVSKVENKKFSDLF